MNDARRLFGPLFTVAIVALVLMAALLAPAPVAQSKDSDLMAFTSQAHMSAFIKRSAQLNQQQSGNFLADTAAEQAIGTAAVKSAYHSTTNVQVAGVQEADTVITDGEYSYLVSWDNIIVVRIYPAAQMGNVSVIDNTTIFGAGTNLTLGFSGIYLYENKLVAIASVQESYYYPMGVYRLAMMPFYYYSQVTIVAVFDMTDPAHPVLEKVEGISGSCTTSRMVGPTLHMVTEQSLWWQEEIEGPYYWSVSGKTLLPAEKIYFDPSAGDPSSFQVLFSLDTVSGAKDAICLLGYYSSVIYMTEGRLYLACPKYSWNESSGSNCVTTIHRITVLGTSAFPDGRVTVDGWLHNQFSMDEKDGVLRLATTSGGRAPVNSVYILSDQMKVAGKLTDIAAGETIQSARFLNDTLYMVTFLRVDPLFVIDLSDATAPRILGELVLPGFSSYLHPLEGGLLLGVGTEGGSVKVDLYDVSDPAHPAVLSSILLPSYSYSEAQWDQKAFMFDPLRNMFALPIHVYGYYPSWTYASSVHLFQVQNDMLSLSMKFIGPASESITRAMFVEDVLYTVSETTITAWNMSTGAKLNSLVYQDQMNYYMMCYAVADTGVVGGGSSVGTGVSGSSPGSGTTTSGSGVSDPGYGNSGTVTNGLSEGQPPVMEPA
ncbi:MAG: beta-propeller domain-containing protein [Methanomassiliicoccales archaeon]